jgi:hypothetical protein
MAGRYLALLCRLALKRKKLSKSYHCQLIYTFQSVINRSGSHSQTYFDTIRKNQTVAPYET